MTRSFPFALAAVVFGMRPLAGCGGGCNAEQQHFQITPPESCLQPVTDVCDAQTGTLKLNNNCAVPLVIDYAASEGGSGSVTIPPGKSADVVVASFSGPWKGNTRTVVVPATLGTTSIVISYDVVSN